MKTVLQAAAATAVCAFMVAAVAADSSKEKKVQKPTGACTIVVYGISPTCTGAMTQDSCHATAKKLGGTSSWQEGKSCAKK